MKLKNLLLMAMLLAITILLGYIPPIATFFLPVPIVMQNLGILLLGGLLGWRKGLLTVVVFLLLAAIGLPVLSGGRGGLAIFFTPSGGYLLGYLLAVILIGSLLSVVWKCMTYTKVLLIVTLGALLINLAGSLFISYYLKTVPIDKMLVTSCLFMIVDMLKVILASTLIYRLRFISLISN